ncbi:hypothetical protein SAICODRAFT_32401 [Saitoella complicata NRRL Y-17804]|nr:uncharacterized protein SAICODRAFT_32401 [Saitoella complicata NRRL Y-17804]ODQ49638.1 hypothetical protein SAICODRAFT_32401 [Saitoella complicata NRRL Y-17804]
MDRPPVRKTYARKPRVEAPMSEDTLDSPPRKRVKKENDPTVFAPRLDPLSPPPSSSPPEPEISPIRRRTTIPKLPGLKRKSTSTTSSGKSIPNPKTTQKIAGGGTLTQLYLDLGQRVKTTCTQCNMSYSPQNPEDNALHSKFHAKSVGGVDFPSPLAADACWTGENGDRVVAVDRESDVRLRRKCTEVMEVVNTELGAAQKGGVGTGTGGEWLGKEGKGYKCFLYVKGKKVVGALLAERITEAYLTLPDSTFPPPDSSSSPGEPATKPTPTPTHTSTSISLSPTPHSSLLGISRIWTSHSHRRQRIASTLLEVARENFVFGVRVGREMVAFSQTTGSGKGLAESFVGGRFAVYVERV